MLFGKRRIRDRLLFLVGAAGVYFLVGCGAETTAPPVHIKDGKVYGRVQGAFRHRWWNYYERALSFMDGEFYEEALSDLKKALEQRDEDQRMARTYGMHFIDYFPHRESGVVHYRMENLEAAERELELSLSQFPSAKAMFYLDRVRKELIEKEARAVTPPRLTLDIQEDEIWTRKDRLVISGVAEDESFVSGITINEEPLFLELSKRRVPFSKALSLSQGMHRVEVEAENLLGGVSRREILIHVDQLGPMITLEEVKPDGAGAGTAVVISGSVYDESGMAELIIDGRSEPIGEGMEISFVRSVPVGRGDVEIRAVDRLGNATSAEVPVAQAAGRADHSPVMVASAGQGAGENLLAGIFGPKDDRPPRIRLSGWTDRQTVFLEKIYLQGEVRDESRIEELTLNDRSLLRRKGKSIFFSHVAELDRGENRILIEARDEAGNRGTKEIKVLREVPEALQLEERLSLTVAPFEQKGLASEISLAFQDTLIDALVDQDRFRVVERDKLDVILQEQNLSQTALVDQATALRLGRLIAAGGVIAGSIIETASGVEIVGRLVDTETSEILATEDVYDEAKDHRAVKSLAEGMAIKFHHDFPLVEGIVVERKGNAIFTDLGKDKVRAQRRLIVYREKPVKHPVTGKVLGADNVIIGRACITQLMPEMSKAELVAGKEALIRQLDKVLTE